MFEQIITVFCAESFFTSAITNIDLLAGIVNKYLAGMSNVRLVSFLLMILAFIVFLFLVIVIYVKAIITFLKLDNSATHKKTPRKQIKAEVASDNDDDTDEDDDIALNLQREIELEELRQRQILDQKMELERQEKRKQDILLQKKEQAQKEQEDKENAENQNLSVNKEFGIDLDWKKGKVAELEQDFSNIVPVDTMSYKQNQKKLSELIGLIINMIARKVDDLKIAQTIMYRNQGQASEDEIMQTIIEVKNFLALAAQGKFNEIRNEKELPNDADAILHLSEGDATYALALIENLMDYKIGIAAAMSNGARKDQIFLETSNMACTFGTLSALSDVRLATSSFELAIELHPQNVNAWNRAADLYNKAGSYNQAMKTYLHVLDIADEEINAPQVANANKMLSQFYYEQGNNLQAAKLYNASKLYYDSLGINRRLDRQELEIISIIEQKQQQDIQQTIASLLANQDLQYGYAL